MNALTREIMGKLKIDAEEALVVQNEVELWLDMSECTQEELDDAIIEVYIDRLAGSASTSRNVLSQTATQHPEI